MVSYLLCEAKVGQVWAHLFHPLWYRGQLVTLQGKIAQAPAHQVSRVTRIRWDLRETVIEPPKPDPEYCNHVISW